MQTAFYLFFIYSWLTANEKPSTIKTTMYMYMLIDATSKPRKNENCKLNKMKLNQQS